MSKFQISNFQSPDFQIRRPLQASSVLERVASSSSNYQTSKHQTTKPSNHKTTKLQTIKHQTTKPPSRQTSKPHFQSSNFQISIFKRPISKFANFPIQTTKPPISKFNLQLPNTKPPNHQITKPQIPISNFHIS